MTTDQPLAVADLGSHSALLLIARQKGGELEVLHEDFVITRLGQGVKQSGLLSEERQQLALQVLKDFKEQAARFGCSALEVIATEALRKARNAESFSQRARQTLNLSIKVLSAGEEARFAYLGAISVFDGFEKQKFTVIDVGGGSTETTLGRGRKIEAHASFPLGAARLAEEMNFKIRLTDEDYLRLQERVERELVNNPLRNEKDDSRVVVGSGGTITTLAAIVHRMRVYDAQRISKTTLELEQIKAWFRRINAMDLKERLRLPGLEAGREDVLPYGLLIYVTMMEAGQIKRLHVSARGLRFGFLLSLLNN
ncbi:Ppx/GppA phosphatase family protein [Caldithrix abyssi]